MADRTPGAQPPATWPGLLRTITDRFRRSEARLTALEAQAGQRLPADYRFEVGEAGELVIRRVSTGATTVIDV